MLQSPIHQYTEAGTFQVTLAASNEAGEARSAVQTIEVGPGAPSRIEISHQRITLEAGGTHAFEATVWDAYGNRIDGAQAEWAGGQAGQVDEGGVFTAGPLAGHFTRDVVARVAGHNLSAETMVTVLPGPLAHVVVDPVQLILEAGASASMSVTTSDQYGNPVTPDQVRWKAANGVGTVDASGAFTAAPRAGEYPASLQVVAVLEGVETANWVDVVVVPGPLHDLSVVPARVTVQAGGQVSLSLGATDQYGNPVEPSEIRWEVAQRVGSVDFNFVFTATTGAGEYPASLKAVARRGDAVAFRTVDVVVSPGPIATLEIAGPSSPLVVGGEALFSATAADAHGNPLPADTVQLTSTGSQNEVSLDGRYVAGTLAGDFEVVATIKAGEETITTTHPVTILAGPLAASQLEPANITIEAGASIQLRATPTDSHGNPVSGVRVSWSSISKGTVDVDSGKITASTLTGTYGPTVQVTVSQGNTSILATADMTVVPGPLHQVRIAPTSVELGTATGQRFVAAARDRFGNLIPNSEITWSTTEGGSVDDNGTYTAGDEPGEYDGSVIITGLEGDHQTEAKASVTIVPQRIMFASDRDSDDGDLYWTAPDGEQTERITTSAGTEEWPRWAPDGRRIAYTEGGYLLYISDDGSWPVAVVEPEVTDEFVAIASEPAWSPDGSKIAYIRIEYPRSDLGDINSSKPVRDLYVADVDGGGVTLLNDTPDEDEYVPSWSPNGHHIVYDRTTEDTVGDIWVINADGSDPREVYSSEENETVPVVSPDGQRIAFVSSQDGDAEIFLVNMDGSGLLQLTHNESYDDSPSWSPGGQRIVFESGRDQEEGEIYTMTPDGSDVVRLTENEDRDHSPSWSPIKQGVPVSAGSLQAPRIREREELLLSTLTEMAQRAVVRVETQRGSGSGFVFDPSGLVLTNNHVVTDAEGITLFWDDGTEAAATLVGRDLVRDLAVLKMVEAPDDLIVLSLAITSDPALGQDILVLGFPLGSDHLSVTRGIVSAYIYDRGRNIHWVQTDAAINPGNSGGPILNLYGEIVGVSAAKFVAVAIEGIAFAIGKDTVQTYLHRLIDGETIGQKH